MKSIGGEGVSKKFLSVRKILQILSNFDLSKKHAPTHRGYNSFKALDADVSAEEMEAFRMKRARFGDDAEKLLEGGGGGVGGHDFV